MKLNLVIHASTLIFSCLVFGATYWLEIKTNGFYAADSSEYFYLGAYALYLSWFCKALALFNLAFSIGTFLHKQWLLSGFGIVICIVVYLSSSYANSAYDSLRGNPCRWGKEPQEIKCITSRSNIVPEQMRINRVHFLWVRPVPKG